MIYLLLIFLLGIMTPIQTAANSRLRHYVTSPIVASLVSFSIGTIYLAIVVAMQEGSFGIGAETFRELPWWAWLGGVCGLYGLTVNIIIFPKLGSVQTALMPMLGQMTMGMLIDHFGWLRSTTYPLTFIRIAALAIILAGVCMVVIKKGEQSGKKNLLPWQLIGISGGAVFAMQPPMNSLLSAKLSSAVSAAFVSFLSATVILYAIVLLRRSDRIHLSQIFASNRPWWVWLGGIIGGTFVTGFAFFASKVGIGLLLITSICGLLTCSLIIDKYGLLGATRKTVGTVQYIGLLFVIAGIIALRMN
ncbi:MAG: DMT family transporter [Prevotellaceae bacterium]|nr:DMT family transporter [Prevotellaceae bacterium]